MIRSVVRLGLLGVALWTWDALCDVFEVWFRALVWIVGATA